jgi:hypothetical protein
MLQIPESVFLTIMSTRSRFILKRIDDQEKLLEVCEEWCRANPFDERRIEIERIIGERVIELEETKRLTNARP